MIGVERDGSSIKSVLSGDEFQVYKTIGDNLTQFFENRNVLNSISVEIHSDQGSNLWLKSLLISITMVTAMFMGCTFNAMSIIGEKEDGISYINEILPITQQEYVFQKITLGLVGSFVPSVATAIVCMRIEAREFLPLLLLIMLSAFISALIGMYIGRFSSGLMVGIIYIKVIMILFIAPSILFYLTVPVDSIGRILTYLLPSSVTFYGLIEMMSGQGQNINIYLAVLLIQSVIWLMIYIFIVNRSKKHGRVLQKL